MLSYGCDLESNLDMILRRFVLTGSDEKPDYKCQQDKDCHFKARLKSSGCYCYGSSCIEEKDGETKTGRAIRTTRKKESSNHDDKGCKCHQGRFYSEWETVWPDSKAKDEGEEEKEEEEEEKEEEREKGGDSLTGESTTGDEGDPFAAL